ncbi:MAG: hypothetical protein LC795_00145 [Acidobacteria bacterium]|nr:hypothetical protein [Acidobacteriota bacterium]
MTQQTTNREIDWDDYPIVSKHRGLMTDLLDRQGCLVSHYSGYRPPSAPALDPQTIERAARNILAGVCFYRLLQDIAYAPYPQTHDEREVAFRRVRATCRHTAEVISAKSAQLRQRKIIPRLEAAARTGNEAAFLDALKEYELKNKSATDFIRIIRLALEAGAHLAARRLSADGARLHPHNVELQKYAHVLAPPQINSAEVPANPKRGANLEWLRIYSEKYKGKWVALRDGELLGTADSQKELVAKIGSTKGTGILVTRTY